MNAHVYPMLVYYHSYAYHYTIYCIQLSYERTVNIEGIMKINTILVS